MVVILPFTRLLFSELHKKNLQTFLYLYYTLSLSTDVFKFARSFEPIIKSTIPLMRTMEPTAMRDYLKTLVQDNLGWVTCPSEEQVLMKMKESLYGLSNG